MIWDSSHKRLCFKAVTQHTKSSWSFIDPATSVFLQEGIMGNHGSADRSKLRGAPASADDSTWRK